ncbi:deacetylase, partial [Pseudoalteromonas citrea]
HDNALIDRELTQIPEQGLTEYDGDSWLCAESFKAIELALGAGILAVDEILAVILDGAFCSVRPAGHHDIK